MSKPSRKLFILPDTSLRRLRMTPSYIFMFWRWSTWLYALVIILTFRPSFISAETTNRGIFLLVVTFVLSLIGTLYAPVFQFLLPRLPRIGVDRLPGTPSAPGNRRATIARQNNDGVVSKQKRNFNIMVYVLDVIICGLVVYFSGPNGGSPFFGDSSPFYRYGMSVALASAFAYGYPGALAASIGYDLFIVFAIIVPAPGSPVGYVPNVVDLFGSLIDTPLIAIIAAYLASLLANYARSRQREQDNVRRQRALVRVGETLIRGVGSQPGSVPHLLQQSVSQLRQGGHFQRLFVAIADIASGDAAPRLLTYVESDVLKDTQELTTDATKNELLTHVLHTGNAYISFKRAETMREYGNAYLYLPFFKDGQVQLVLGAESLRQTPFGKKQEEFLTIAGAQLLVALDNIRLAEQMVDLAATAERGRIAREIHDGVAQLVYMMSLNIETCVAQAHSITEVSEEDAALVRPLATRLDTLVAISKQALWETRNYMFNLKPLLSGDMSLTQMLTNQVREFQTISGMPTRLLVEGDEDIAREDPQHVRKYAQTGAAIFRIVQEALTNAYKHAQASQLWVRLVYAPQQIEVEICDNGQGNAQLSQTGEQRIYSGHGVRGMRERAEELGGTFEMTPTEVGGVRICVTIPM